MVKRFGYCGWLLYGKRLPEIIEFLHQEGFNSISWLQSILKVDPEERRDAAAAIKEKDFTLCWHGNVQNNMTPENTLDESFAGRVFEDVLWWHENTNGVVSCCSDALHRFGREQTFRLLQLQSEIFEGTGIGYGIENAFGKSYASLDEMNEYRERLKKICPARDAGMIFDVGHANIYLKKDCPEKMTLREYINRIPFRFFELHITDNHGLTDEHFMPGTGNIDFTELREALEEKGFNGVISLEVCRDIQNGLYGFDVSDPADQDIIRRARDSFRKLFEA